MTLTAKPKTIEQEAVASASFASLGSGSEAYILDGLDHYCDCKEAYRVAKGRDPHLGASGYSSIPMDQPFKMFKVPVDSQGCCCYCGYTAYRQETK